MSEQKKQIVFAICLALIVVTVLAGASYYLIPLEAPQPTAPFAIPTPIPPTAAPTSTPIPHPAPKPGIPPHPSVEVELNSTTGFDITDMGNTYEEKVLVLRHGTSANITFKISSHHN